MNLNDCPNYQFISQEKVQEIHSECFLYKHSKSGARILFLENNDDNKVFCVSFKTPAENDNGVAHIMEHSVLCGSRRYPVKEPFVELMKSSLNTFLNAMTYPDKTIYPIASRNHKDFHNLADVYLDAVFFPELSQQAFEQEGWHYEHAEDSLIYKGVVFNEMKGVFSSPESYLDLAVNRALYPDSSYRFESGGTPEAITDLSYEEYLQFHREKYHPANASIIITGDVNRQQWLDYLDQDYLSHFDAPTFALPQIIAQEKLSEPVEVTCSYPADEDTGSKSSLLLLYFLTVKTTECEINFAMGVLDSILIGSAASPLRKALLESQLGDDILDYGYMNETLQTTWSVGLRDADAASKEAFKKLFFDTLQKIVDEGISKKLIEASLNACEFQLREANFGSYPKSLVYSMNIMSRWLYDATPMDNLKYEDLLTGLKEKIAKGGYFEELITQCFLDNKHYALVTCSPQLDLSAQLLEVENKRLAEHLDSLDEKQINELKEANDILNKRQQTPDSPEAVATIPHVSIKDIPQSIESIPSEETLIGKTPAFYHDLPSQGIIYADLSFNCAVFTEADYPYLSLLAGLLLKCGTKNYSYDEFSQEVDCSTGGISAGLAIYSSKKRSSGVGTRLYVKAKVMKDKLPELQKLLTEVLCEINFTDKRRIKELLGSMTSRLKTSILNNGDRTARGILLASLSPSGYLGSLVSGPKYLEFLKKITSEFESDSSILVNKLLSLKKIVFEQTKLSFNISADKELLGDIKKSFSSLVDLLPLGSEKDAETGKRVDVQNTALFAPGAVQYVVKGINIKDLGYKSNGSIDLLNQLLSTGYLWERVRVQGGAYGSYMVCDKISGALQLASYRDPNLQETLDVYDALGDYLETLEISQEELDKLIIGTVGRIDAPMTTSQKGAASFNRHLTGISEDELNLRRRELLECSVEDLRAFAPYFKELATNGILCVHGNEKKLSEAEGLFQVKIQLEESQ
ncbi:MAG: insulinase family protein [Lentisphaeraceae bacterium]|nr:insulinase family protein [Lentisphaeraceae bacterium]